MRHLAAALKFGWSWWTGFGVFIAAPALALALLGLRAVRAERIERAQQLREQQTQIARLADAALAAALSELETALQRAAEPAPSLADGLVFTFEPPGLLVFQPDKVWFGETEAAKLRAVDWPLATQRLIEQAQAMEAQGDARAAAGFYRRLSVAEPKLRGWAEFCLARNGQQRGAAGALALLANPLWGRAEDLTPSGLPVALLICPYVERLPEAERGRFTALLRQTLEHLRSGRWWLSYDERQFYDQELRRLLAAAKAKAPAEDARLGELAGLERLIRAAAPDKYPAATCSFEREGASAYLLLWTRASGAQAGWRGLALAQSRVAGLSETALAPLLTGQPFAAAMRDAHGELLWGRLPNETTNAFAVPVRSVRGLELVFGGAAQRGWAQRREWLWYGFILALVVMLAVGLAMTARVVQREVELGRLQNEFIAAVSHEFKSPITSIRLLMERITSGRVHSAAEYHTAINRETDRLERLVNRLLEAQQIQAGRRQYDFAPASLGAIIETAAAQLHPQAEAKGIRLETRIAADLPELPLDKLALTDALENLLDNAIKYSPASTRVTVTARAVEQTVRVEVYDEGIGIEPGDLPRIFDRFYRARHGNQHSVKGTGLGLALVKAAVEAHGGTVEVASRPGAGSRFSLRLPINGSLGTHVSSVPRLEEASESRDKTH